MTRAARNGAAGRASRCADPMLVRPIYGGHSCAVNSRGPHPELSTPATVVGGGRDGSWNTGGVGWTDRQVRRLSTAARWTLLAAVLAGLFGMHVLTAEDGSSGHGGLPMISTSGHAGMTVSVPSADPMPVVMDAVGSLPGIAAVLSADPDPGAGGDHGAMAGCILFLVVGGAALILLLVRLGEYQGTAGLGRSAGFAVTGMRRRGPPGRWPRLALCVIRV
jgi:hypothetical protein